MWLCRLDPTAILSQCDEKLAKKGGFKGLSHS